MRKIVFLLLGSLVVASLAAHAQAPTPTVIPKPSLPSAAIPEPAAPKPPTLDARSFILADYSSGQVLAEKDLDQRVEPASLTKVMSAYVIFDMLRNGKLNRSDMVVISELAWKMEGSRMFAKVGSQLPVGDLLKGMIIQSGNDSTVALAEHIAGSEESFVSLMNQYAQRLGMTGSHFTNSAGMPDANHYTTARDMYLLAVAMIRDFPEDYKEYSQKEFTHNGIKQTNRNRLLWLDPTVDGIKTGHTNSAGYSLMVSAVRDGMRLISVVMGTDSDKTRTQSSLALINYGYRFFETRRLYSSAEALAKARVWKGEVSEFPLGVNSDLFVTFPRGKYEELKVTLDRPRVLEAPIAAGQDLGQVTIVLADQVLQQTPLVAKAEVAKGGLFKQAFDSLLLLFE
ncbi:MAG: D-alanyl-D-alanine carboxypeptidase family protein [Thiotrichales bacterium]